MFHQIRYEDIWDRSSSETEDFNSVISLDLISFSGSTLMTHVALSMMDGTSLIFVNRSFTESSASFVEVGGSLIAFQN